MLRVRAVASGALVFFLCALDLGAQQSGAVFRRVGSAQGLSNDVVFSIAQDDMGFLWLATADGLNRHDGLDFKVFRHDPADPGSLSDSWIRQVLVDRQGVLWVGTWTGGLNRFDRAGESFVRYRHDPADPSSLSDDSIRALHEDGEGVLWIGTQSGGLNRFHRETGLFTRYTHDPGDPRSLGDDHLEVITEDRSGVLWIGTHGGGLNRFDRETQSFTRYRHRPEDPHSLGHDDVRGIYEDRSGVFWVATWGGGLQRFDRRSERFFRHTHDPGDPGSLSDYNVRQILEDRSGNMWVATAGGLNRLDRASGRFTRYRHDPTDSRSLSHDHVRGIFEDRQGALWLATLGGGVNRYDPAAAASFVTHRLPPEGNVSLIGNTVVAITEDRAGSLWLGTNGAGLLRMGRGERSVVHFRADPKDPASLSHDSIWALLADRSGALWIGTEGGGLDRLDLPGSRFVHFRHDPEDPGSLSHDHVLALTEDRDGGLWIGTDGGGVNRLDRATGRFERFRHDPEDPGSLSHDHVMTLYEDRFGVLWVGTWGGGLNRLDRQRADFVRYRHDPSDPRSLAHDSVFAIREDASGVLWIATMGGGLHRFDREREDFERFGEADGLPSRSLTCLLGDAGGNLWISTLNGLVKFDPASRIFRRFAEADGLLSAQLTQGCYQSPQGEMFVGGWRGVTEFRPDLVRLNGHVPPVAITDFELGRKPVAIGPDSTLQRSILETETLTLSHDDRVLSFQFAALDYRDPEKNRYRFKLEGFEEAWNETDGSRRYVNYTNLDPGAYTFRVLGSNNQGVWNEEGASLGLVVLAPWWQRWEFRLAAIAVFVALATAGYRRRTAGIARQARRLGQIFDSAPDALLLSRSDGTISFANEEAERLLGHPPRDLVGRDLGSLVAERFRAAHVRHLGDFFADPKAHPTGTSRELCVLHRDGREIPVEVTLSVVETDDGLLASGALRDVSERKKAEDDLKRALSEAALLRNRLAAENVYLKEEIQRSSEFEEIIGESPALKQVLFKTEQVAATDSSVLLLGETGTGKELIARAIHQRSDRRDRSLVKVNCAAIPADLLESELFGHEKGAFTGALKRRLGRFELADGGTLFLDEIGDLPLDLQGKLLRVLQEGELERLGSAGTLTVDVRIVSATNRDLEQAIAEGSFRSDLYFRLGVFPITVPPLSERREDIPLLVWHFINKHNARLGTAIDKVSRKVMDDLVSYRWPGNVRELENVIERAMILSPGSTLVVPELAAAEIAPRRRRGQATVGRAAVMTTSSLEDTERGHILGVLEQCGWKINGRGNAAELLGINPSTLRFRMKKLGIERPETV